MKIISAVLLMLLFLPALYFHPVSVFTDLSVLALENPDLNTPTFEVLTFSFAEGIPSLIKIIIGWAFKLAGVFAFAMIVFAGFQFLTSGGNTAQQKDAQDKITGAIVGLVLLFAFYIILYTINPDILREPSKPPPIDIDLGVGPQSFPFSTSSEDISGVPLKLSKECPDGKILDPEMNSECIPDNNSVLISETSYGEEGWSCEFKGKGPNDAGVYNKPGGTLHLYCLPAPEIEPTPEIEPSKNLVNIIGMGIPVNAPTLGKSEAYLDKTLADTLLALKDKTPAWLVTDACIDSKCQSTSEPNRRSDDCHLDGTCADIDSASGNYNDNIKLIEIFNDAGLAVLDEGSHLHVALMGASGYGSYANSGCETSPCEVTVNGVKAYWYAAH
jgi:hypothetical protein